MPCWHAPVLTILKVTLHRKQVFSMQSDNTPLFFASIKSFRIGPPSALRPAPYAPEPDWHTFDVLLSLSTQHACSEAAWQICTAYCSGSQHSYTQLSHFKIVNPESYSLCGSLEACICLWVMSESVGHP